MALIIYSLYVRVRMLMLGTSLWNDEAFLVECIVDRSFSEILQLPYTYPRTEPFLYMIVVKTLTMIFGASEAVLRVFSFISLIGMLIAQGILLRKVFKLGMMMTLFSVAVSSTFLFFMQYSAMFRPYMGDATFVLFVLLGYYAYKNGFLGRGIRSILLLTLIFIICMLFSSPAVFAAVAVFLTEFVVRCIRKDKRGVFLIIIGGIVFLAAFYIYYSSWLSPIASDGAMSWIWNSRRFDLTISGREDLLHNYTLMKDLLHPVWPMISLILPFAIAGVVISLIKKNVYTICVGVFLILLIIASSIGKYPMQDRLWMPLFVFLFMYSFVFINVLRTSFKKSGMNAILHTGLPLMLAFSFLVPNLSFPAYGKGEDWTLMPGNQANPLISYVDENIQEGEILYSYISANNVLRYRNGYGSDKIGNVSEDNIVWGDYEYIKEAELAMQTGAAYILFNHSYFPLSRDPYVSRITQHLSEIGYIEQIMNVNHTYLYWVTNDFNKTRTKASLEIKDLTAEQGRVSGVFRIDNLGPTILSPETPEAVTDPIYDRNRGNFGRLYILLRETGSPPTTNPDDAFILGVVESPLNQGEFYETWINRDGIESGDYQIELIAENQFTSEQLGIEPVKVSIK